MQLTTTQKQDLKSWVTTNANGVYEPSTVVLLNAISSPDYYVLKTLLSVSEIMANGFDWTRVDNATAGQARIWEWMTDLGVINPSRITILRGIGEAWKGNSPAAQTDHRRAILAHCRRPVRVWEKLYVTATADWNVASNGDQTGIRGATTNPDTLGIGQDGEYLSGLMDLDTLISVESA